MSLHREWLCTHAPFTEPDAETGAKAGETLTPALFAREIVDRYVRSEVKPPWYVDLLNLNLDNDDLPKARAPRAVPQRLQP